MRCKKTLPRQQTNQHIVAVFLFALLHTSKTNYIFLLAAEFWPAKVQGNPVYLQLAKLHQVSAGAADAATPEGIEGRFEFESTLVSNATAVATAA